MASDDGNFSIGSGLPHSISEGETGFERLNTLLGLNRLQRKALIEKFTRDRARNFRHALGRQRLRPGARDRLLMVALYGDPEFRLSVWRTIHRLIAQGREEKITRITPSIEHRLLSDLEVESPAPEEAEQIIRQAFSAWPDLAERAATSVEWGGYAAVVWNTLSRELERWDELPEADRLLLGERIFALATIVNDYRPLTAAAERAAPLAEEFSDLLNACDDSDNESSQESREVLESRWNELCDALAELATEAAGPPPQLDTLTKISTMVGDLEKIEDPLRRVHEVPGLDTVIERIYELLAQPGTETDDYVLHEAELHQLRGEWDRKWNGMEPDDKRQQLERLEEEIPALVTEVRQAREAMSTEVEKLNALEKERPTEITTRHEWEEQLEAAEDRVRDSRRLARAAEKPLLKALAPPAVIDDDVQPAEQSQTAESSADDVSAAPEQATTDGDDVPSPTKEPSGEPSSADSEEPETSEPAAANSHRAEPPAVGRTEGATAEADEGSERAEALDVPGEPIEESPKAGSETPQASEPSPTEPTPLAKQVRHRLAEALQAEPPDLPTAVQLVRLADRVGAAPEETAEPLLEAALYSNHLRLPDGALEGALRRIMQDFPVRESFDDDVARDIHAMLTLAATLRPALLAPHSGALSFLAALSGSDLGAVYTFATKIAGKLNVLQGVRIDSSVLRGARSEAGWETDRARLEEEAAEWRDHARHMTILYNAASQVWQLWQKPDGVISRLLDGVGSGKIQDEDAVDTTIRQLTDRKSFEELVRRTDRQEIGRKRGNDIHARALDQLYAHTQQAVELARRELALRQTKPEKNNFLATALADVRDTLDNEAPAALDQLEEMTRSGHPMLGGVANVAAHAVRGFQGLFDPEHKDLDKEPAPEELLATGLFGHPDIHISDSGDVLDDAGPALENFLARREPLPLRDAFGARLEEGDIAAAKRILEWMDVEAGEDTETLWEQLEEARKRQAGVLRAALGETRPKVEEALALGYLSDAERARLDAILVDLERRLTNEQIGRFKAEHQKLSEVAESLEKALVEQKQKARQALDGLEIDTSDERAAMITHEIDEGDIVTANELIDRLRLGELPAEPAPPRRDPFESFFPDTARAIDRALEKERSSKAIIGQIERGDSFAGLPMGKVAGAQRNSAGRMLRAWYLLKRAGQLNEQSGDQVRQLMSEIGLLVKKVKAQTRRRNVGEAELVTEPLRERTRCPIPAYGSLAGGRYRLLLLWGRPTVDDVLQFANDGAGQQPSIVLFMGRLGEEKRRELAETLRQRARSLLVIDETLLIFLCAETGSRVPVLFAGTLPFTHTQPYVTTAGLVPPEMFYGREREHNEVAHPSGPCFIYGGRQLGKTALLRAVERTVNLPAEGRYAIWIDLKGEGIGYDRGPGAIWPAIWRALNKLNAIPGEIKEPNPNVRGRVDDFVHFLRQHFANSAQRSLLLLLDEADRFLEVDAHDDDTGASVTGYRESSRLKVLMDETERSIKVVFAGLHNVLRTVEYANHPLGHFGHPIQIGPLLADGAWRDAEALLREPMTAVGYRFESSKLVTRVLAQTNYYPSLIQLYGAALINAMVPDRTRGAPPYTITESVLDETYQNRNLREMIRSRFHLTLQLDPRYEVIAYAIAHECLERESLLAEGLNPAVIDDAARTWWPEGFGDMESGTHRFRALLDEMVGLGVLRRLEDGRYTLRNPNVLLLMGSQEEIADNLLRTREPPLEFEPDIFRARDPNWPENPERSPLTFQQEATLQAESNGVTVVCGVPASGLSQVVPFLRARSSENQVVELDDLTDRNSLETALERIKAQRPEGTTIYAIPADIPWSEQWVETALARVTRLNAKGRYVRVVFLADPPHLWQLLPELERLERSGLKWVSLRPWKESYLRQWMEDVGFGNDPSVRQEVFSTTGAWPALLLRLNSLAQENTDVSAALEQLAAEMSGEEDARELLGEFGLDDPAARLVLHPLSELGREDQAELEKFAVADEVTPDTLRARLRWAELLHLVHRVGKNTWEFPSVPASILSRAGY